MNVYKKFCIKKILTASHLYPFSNMLLYFSSVSHKIVCWQDVVFVAHFLRCFAGYVWSI